MLERKYRKGSDVWRVRVEGEFPRGESETDAYVLTFGEYLMGNPESIMLPSISGVSIKR